MKRTGYIYKIDNGRTERVEVEVESCGTHHENGPLGGCEERAIWKSLDDAFECWLMDSDGHLTEHEVDTINDDLTDVYGTYVDENGERVEYKL